ncbi:MAG: OmpA family protein [Bacteroidota bacterium]
MKRFILCTLLVAAFGFQNHLQAQFMDSKLAWGLEAGGAHGGNHSADKWGMQYRGFLQFDLLSPNLIGQLGMGYTKLVSPNVYSAETGIGEVRLLLSPFSLPDLFPYLYAGFAGSKQLNVSGSDLLMMVPFGAGIQTRLSRSVFLSINGGYNLSLSDKLDGRVRTDTDLNDITNSKHDGFYGFSAGLAFSLGSSYQEARDKEKALADAETARLKQQADAAAEARRVKEASDAEARRVRELADAEARRVKQAADAAAEAQRVKGATDAESLRIRAAADAEARRVKDLADAEARRLADLKKAGDMIIILEKGKKVVLTGVTFEFNKATLTYASERILTVAYNALVANPDVSVEISGHTDNVGSQQYNQSLSLQRAQSVKNWLVQKGIPSNRMKTVGKGMNEPVASNVTDSGRAENRRIEFYVEQ